MTSATSLADRLVCIDCRAVYPLDYRLECPACRGLLELRYDLDVMRREGAGDAEDDEILAAQQRLARVEGIWAGPTGVAALAVLIKLLTGRQVDPAQTFCVIVTETGLRTEAVAPSRAATAFDYVSLARLVEERLAR